MDPRRKVLGEIEQISFLMDATESKLVLAKERLQSLLEAGAGKLQTVLRARAVKKEFYLPLPVKQAEVVKPLLHELRDLHVSLQHLISTRIGVTLTAVRKALPEEKNPIYRHASARTLAAGIISKWKKLLPKPESDKPTAESAKKATMSTGKTQSSTKPSAEPVTKATKSTAKTQPSAKAFAFKRPRETESETEQSSGTEAKHKHKSKVGEKEKDEDLEKLQSKHGMGPSIPSVTPTATALQSKRGLMQPPIVITKPSHAGITKPSPAKIEADRLARLEAAENRRNFRKREEGVQAVVKVKDKVAISRPPGSNVFGVVDVDLEEDEVDEDANMPADELEVAIEKREYELHSCREQIKGLVKNVNSVEHRQLSRDIQWHIEEIRAMRTQLRGLNKL